MTNESDDMSNEDVKHRLLEAAKPHVPFDGWSGATLAAAARDADVSPGLVRAVFPRGAIDLALAYHAAGDAQMLERLTAEDLDRLRFRDRIAAAVRFRLEAVEDRELVRRGMTLFALPHHAADGTQALWRTADRIWLALGDTARDVNWYTKRATLSGVYASTMLYWLGDDSPDHQDSWAFLDRRIEDVMQFEKFKARTRDSRVLSSLLAGPLALLGRVKAPDPKQQAGMPGRWSDPG